VTCNKYGLLVEQIAIAVIFLQSMAKHAVQLIVTCSEVIRTAAIFVLVQNADAVYTHTTFNVRQKASHQPL
jgi:hypothetical protein